MEISLDHDLGDDDSGTGYDVVLWIEEAVVVDAIMHRIGGCQSKPAWGRPALVSGSVVCRRIHSAKNGRITTRLA